MAVATGADGARAWRRRTPRGDLLAWAGWLAAVALTLACFQYISERTIWAFVWDAPAQGADLVGRMFPPRWFDPPRCLSTQSPVFRR